MKLFSGLTRRSAERDSFVTDSLSSSSGISARLLEFSGSHDPERPVSVRFPLGWDHAECPTGAWYKERNTSTRFRSIEHRRSTVKPFYHEFLLLKLTDGAVCRLERFGEGSRTDAIRYVGCTSYDIIQWYDTSNAASAANAIPSDTTVLSELVAEIEYDREFDILDVLAVCYSIQRVKRCSVYTLQRYNCYFLCLTVLAVLARRTASWETAVTNEVWTTGITSGVESLCEQPVGELQQNLFVRICATLEPDGLQPGQSIIRLLPKYLAPESCLPASCATAIATTLWESSMSRTLGEAMEETVRACLNSLLLEAEGHVSTKLHELIKMGQVDVQEKIAHDAPLADQCVKILLAAEAQGCIEQTRESEAWLKMQQIECRPSLGTRMLHDLIPAAMTAFLLLAPSSLMEKPGGEKNAPSFNRVMSKWSYRFRYLALVRPVILESIIEDTLESAMSSAFIERASAQQGRVASILYYESLLKSHASSPFTPEQLPLLIGLSLDTSTCACLLSQCMITSLAEHLRLIVESQSMNIWVVGSQLGSAPAGRMTCAKFQATYILPRIEAHAKHVEAVQLAASRLVREDMEITMTNVWQSMPKGFGATVNEDLRT